MTREPRHLSVWDHDRSVEGLAYVYPVVSRRAGGVSVGINLNPNNACNWRCAYCQVENLTRGQGPPLDLAQLESELVGLLDQILFGDFLARRVPPEARRLNDVALSGNGEPTTSPQLGAVVSVVSRVLDRFGLRGKLKVILITNGSMVGKRSVRCTLGELRALGGEVWFKLDSASREGLRSINGCAVSPERHLARLEQCALLCPTWVQTCVFSRKGAPPTDQEQSAFVEALSGVLARSVPIQGVLLYTLARQPRQPGAEELQPLPEPWLHSFAERLQAIGLETRVST